MPQKHMEETECMLFDRKAYTEDAWHSVKSSAMGRVKKDQMLSKFKESGRNTQNGVCLGSKVIL